MAAPLLNPVELPPSLVEIVIAERRHLQTGKAQRLDGRLVMKQAGQKRRGPDVVACKHDNRVWIRGFEPREMRGEILDAARILIADAPGPSGGRFEPAVKVVDGEELH